MPPAGLLSPARSLLMLGRTEGRRILESIPHTAATVLIVDDHDDTREALAAVIGYGGFAVEVASDGDVALDYLRRSGGLAGVIVLDLMMPRMDGHAFLAAKAADPALRHIPVVVHSALDPEGLPGDVRYLPKVRTDVDELLDVIARACRRSTETA